MDSLDLPRSWNLLLSLMLIIILMPGCITNQDNPEESAEPSPSWNIGDWWQYQIEGTVPTTWMDPQGTLSDAVETTGHMPEFQVETSAEFVAVPSLPLDSNYSMQDKPQRILSDDPELEFLGWFGLPLSADWFIEEGTASAPKFDYWQPHQDAGVSPPLHGTRFFDWPLTEGKQWNTNFMYTDLEITAQKLDEGYVIEATSGDTTAMRYHYDPRVKWFSWIEILGPSGEVVLNATLLDHGIDYAGSVHAWLKDAGDRSLCYGGANPLPASAGSCPSIPSTVPEGKHATLRSYFAHLSEGDGALSILRSHPGGTVEEWHTEACPCDTVIDKSETDLAAGEYVWNINSVESGDRWLFFFAATYCTNEYQFEEGQITMVEDCKEP